MRNGAINVGFDGGENSLGAAAIRISPDGLPQEILSLMVFIHDGGKDIMASSQTNSVSRKASGGIARRHRHLLTNRRKRRKALEQALKEHSYPVADRNESESFEPWAARLRLVSAKIPDETERRALISRALRHMERHRGYASAWVRLETYWDAEAPSQELSTAAESATSSGAFPSDVHPETIQFQCQLAQYGFHGAHAMRPIKDPQKTPLLGSQRRVDVVREWREICRVQQLSRAEFELFARIVFTQKHPTVPVENVGHDWLPGYTAHTRAPMSSMEHQEFRIWQEVTNLSVKAGPRSKDKIPLTIEEKQLIADHLLGITTDKDRLSWKDIAEKFLDVPPNLLTHTAPDEQLAARAPANVTLLTLHKLPKKHPIITWWQSAPIDDRHAFISFLLEQSHNGVDLEHEAMFSELMDSLSDNELEALLKLRFPAGRSAHSGETLRLMTQEMRVTGDPYATVKNRLFGEGKDIRPAASSLNTQATHPTLQRILPLAKKFLSGVEHEYGPIDRVTIEHVRGAFLGLQAKAEEASRMRRNERDRLQIRADVLTAFPNLASPSHNDIRKAQTIAQQNSTCLYCGASLHVWGDVELDHIVPRATGGNSTRANLVAVCRACNATKGKLTFVEFANSGKRPAVSLEGALERVREMLPGSIDRRQFARMQAEMRRRLKQTSEDEPIDERSLASTAYAATDLRERVMGSLNLSAAEVPVYSGKVVSMARKASGIDRRIELRPGLHSKSRFDRRHHAIDAAVASLLNPSVARTLAEREDLRNTELTTGKDTGWKTYEGSGPEAINKFRQWKRAMHAFADLCVDYLAQDKLIVTQPVRFSAHHAALHKEGRVKHARKKLGSSWSPAERSRVVDNKVYEALSVGHLPSATLEEDENRDLTLPSGKKLGYGDDIFLFPDTAARHPLSNASSSELGASLHHVRLYRWVDAKGKTSTGVVRVYASDLYELQGGVTTELLRTPFVPHSRAIRRMSVKTQDAIANGSAKHVGSFVRGDEIHINPAEWQGTDGFSEFLKTYPETRWQLTGWESEKQLNLRPLVLSAEGITTSNESAATDSRLVQVEGAVQKLFERGARISASKLWATPATLVVRRGALGKVRAGNGPTASWSPYNAVSQGN